MKKEEQKKEHTVKEIPCHIKHPNHIKGFTGSIDELAYAIGNTTYDVSVDVLGKLADDYTRQADADKARGRVQLATQLYKTAEKLYEARDAMQQAWNICKPYMQVKKEQKQ
ncbi:hypothetical protein K9M74_00720 [Candidatus Woesearchaeota archaeon]|nr:hypothetical protein [Candidatus Woesearchaeota archaeon]